jgi:pimeloyl-ACP methyl ester carboxylesterase
LFRLWDKKQGGSLLRKISAVVAAIATAAGLGVTAPALASAATNQARTAASPSASEGTSSITWGTCPEADLVQVGATCGLLSVPLDYADPSGPKIKIAVSRILHTSSAKNYRGIILTNPGGPGGSGLDLNTFLVAQLKADKLSAAANDYDWIGFDPRGVGNSVPALSCDPNYFSPDRKSYTPTTPAILSYWLGRSAAYDKDCTTQSAAQSALLDNMTTVDSARDMNSIRQALAGPQGKMSYYGFSYGTYLGQVYATLYPHTLNQLILDSNVNPKDVWYKANLNQDIAFNRNVNIWFAWLAKYNSFYHLGATAAAVSKRWYAEKAYLTQHPINGKVGPDEWTDIFLEAGYYQQTWLQLGSAFADWENTHSAAAAKNLVSLYESTDGLGDDNEFAVYNAVQCTDVQWPTSWATWQRDNDAVNKIAPFETWDNAWFNAPCLHWPAPAHHPVQVAGLGSGKAIHSALLIDETLDAATPFPGSLEVRKLFPNSVLLAEPGGTSHADSLFGNLCVDGTIASYLETGKTPPRKAHAEWDLTCKPLPVPNPTTDQSAASAANAANSAAARAAR